MRLAYFSPLNPVKSGISDFSETLLPYLNKSMELTVFTTEARKEKIENEWIRKNLTIRHIQDYNRESLRNTYDAAVFHMGNNYSVHKEISDLFLKYGGILELHDLSLHHFVAAETIDREHYSQYKKIMQYCHGNRGKKTAELYLEGKIAAPWEKESMRYTVNKHYIDRAQAVIVHSDFAKQMVKGVNSKATVMHIPHGAYITDDPKREKQASRRRLGIAQEEFVLGTFGYIWENKRVDSILNALQIYKQQHKEKPFHFYIVGEVNIPGLKETISKLQLSGQVTVTGFVSLTDLEDYIKACDIAFNLRYPTQGESSGTLCRLLGMGKIVMVTDIGSFSEYPEDVICRIRYDSHETDDIVSCLEALATDSKRMEQTEKQVLSYMKKYSWEENAKRYASFFQHIQNHTFYDDSIERILDKIFELNLIHKKYIRLISKKLL